MAKTASNVIALAKSEVGYLEKNTKYNLDSKTGNAGFNNYTKYARDLDAIPNFYNTNKQGYPWCDVFFDWLLVTSFGADAAKEMIGQPDDSYGAGCGYSAKYYKSVDRLFTKDPKPGDQIFFWNSRKTEISHTGLVCKVEKGRVYTIEGNTSSTAGVVANGGGVFEKSYSTEYDRIYGYGRPKYDEEPVDEVEDETCCVTLRMLRNGTSGADVKAMQILLEANGCKGRMDSTKYGSFGAKTENAVRLYQKKASITNSGVCDQETWNKLLGV